MFSILKYALSQLINKSNQVTVYCIPQTVLNQ